MATCERHPDVKQIAHGCYQCGAPQCCPACCDEATAEDEAHRREEALARDLAEANDRCADLTARLDRERGLRMAAESLPRLIATHGLAGMAVVHFFDLARMDEMHRADHAAAICLDACARLLGCERGGVVEAIRSRMEREKAAHPMIEVATSKAHLRFADQLAAADDAPTHEWECKHCDGNGTEYGYDGETSTARECSWCGGSGDGPACHEAPTPEPVMGGRRTIHATADGTTIKVDSDVDRVDVNGNRLAEPVTWAVGDRVQHAVLGTVGRAIAVDDDRMSVEWQRSGTEWIRLKNPLITRLPPEPVVTPRVPYVDLDAGKPVVTRAIEEWRWWLKPDPRDARIAELERDLQRAREDAATSESDAQRLLAERDEARAKLERIRENVDDIDQTYGVRMHNIRRILNEGDV